MRYKVITSLALALGLAFAVSADVSAAPTDAASKSGGKTDAHGQGNNIGDGKISITSNSLSSTIGKTHAKAGAHANATGLGKSVDAAGKTRVSRVKAKGDAVVDAKLNKNGVATVTSRAAVDASAAAKPKTGKGVAQGGKVVVTASATGGAHPKAQSQVKENGKVTLKASAKAGAGATASGGKTVVKHFGPGGKDTLAITYNKHAYAAGVSTPNKAIAYAGYSAKGVSFSGPTLVAALQRAAFAYAAAGNNYAVGYATASAYGDARSGNSSSWGNLDVYASAFVNGNTVLLKGAVGGGKLGKKVIDKVCTYATNAGGVTLTCHSVGN
jgi:hypothetical protein